MDHTCCRRRGREEVADYALGWALRHAKDVTVPARRDGDFPHAHRRTDGPHRGGEAARWRIVNDPTFDPPGRTYTFGWGSDECRIASHESPRRTRPSDADQRRRLNDSVGHAHLVTRCRLRRWHPAAMTREHRFHHVRQRQPRAAGRLVGRAIRRQDHRQHGRVLPDRGRRQPAHPARLPKGRGPEPGKNKLHLDVHTNDDLDAEVARWTRRRNQRREARRR